MIVLLSVLFMKIIKHSLFFSHHSLYFLLWEHKNSSVFLSFSCIELYRKTEKIEKNSSEFSFIISRDVNSFGRCVIQSVNCLYYKIRKSKKLIYQIILKSTKWKLNPKRFLKKSRTYFILMFFYFYKVSISSTHNKYGLSYHNYQLK